MGLLERIRTRKTYRAAKKLLEERLFGIPGVFGVGFSEYMSGIDEVFVHQENVPLRSITDVVSQVELETGFIWEIRPIGQVGEEI